MGCALCTSSPVHSFIKLLYTASSWPMCMWLSDIEEERLRQHFNVCGAITNVRVIRDEKTGAGKGFGYVTFEVMYSVQIEKDNLQSVLL